MRRLTVSLLLGLLLSLAWFAGVLSAADNTVTGYNILQAFQVQTQEIHGLAEATLVDATPTAVATFTLADGEAAGGIITGTIHCTDGTDTQALTTEVHWSAVRKASTVTVSTLKSASTLEAKAVSAGTLITTGGANGWTATTTSSSVTILLDADTSLTPTSLHFHFVAMNNHDSDATYP